MLTADQATTILNRTQTDPGWWIEHVLGNKPWDKQTEILAHVRDTQRTAVASCHGAGKSWIAARAALWFLYAFPNSIVVTTAPTFRQVRNVLWQEMRRAYRGALVPLGGHLNQTDLRLDDGWFAFGLTADDSDAFQGLHAEHLMVIVDEAAGLPPAIWTAIEGLLTSAHVRLLAIGNPTDPSGPFYDMFRQPGIAKVHISAFDTPNVQAGETIIPGLVTTEWVEERKQIWGEGSPLYQSRVLGEFPDAGTDTLIPLSWVEAAQQRELPAGKPKELGVDVARFGDDETVIALREGSRVRIVERTRKHDTMDATGRVTRQLSETGAGIAKVDVIGIGSGVVDRGRETGKPFAGFNVGSRAADNERFANARAEWYWGLRERFEQGDIDLDPADEELAGQLTGLRYEITSRGQIKIESKDDSKKRGVPSPDLADAVMLAYATQPQTGARMIEYYEPVRISPY